MRRLIIAGIIVLVLVFIGYFWVQRGINGEPVDYSTDADSREFNEQFKYGSIGSDAKGIPYKLWKILPVVFKDRLPAPANGYEALGFIQEEGKPTPIGFSVRKGFINTVGLNCASCHTGDVRERPGAPRKIYSAMPAQQLDLGKYFNFLFACAQDPRFNRNELMKALEEHEGLGFLEKLFYPSAIDQTKQALLEQAKALSYMASRPEMGPGRVDTFNPYKVLFFHVDMTNDHTIGTVDFPAIWDQDIKRNLWMHWDGNNNSIDERNISAALGAGANPKTVDLTRINRIREWLMPLPKPDYPFATDQKLVSAGEPIYRQQCAKCHEPGGSLFGAVSPGKELGTDPHRVDSFDEQMAERMNTLGEGYPWQFRHFRKTDGYANRPLDGVWARGPFLHNGSVPTLYDLLEVPANRPAKFYRGNDVYDTDHLGFISSVAEQDGHAFFLYDTTLPGNSNAGHLYGTNLSPADKRALLEYLKTR